MKPKLITLKELDDATKTENIEVLRDFFIRAAYDKGLNKTNDEIAEDIFHHLIAYKLVSSGIMEQSIGENGEILYTLTEGGVKFLDQQLNNSEKNGIAPENEH